MADIKNKSFNEATRVQMPALVHLSRLGYEYYGKINEEMKGNKYDGDTNILLKVFKNQFKKLNPKFENEVDDVLRSIHQELDNDDLGKSFYKRLTSISPLKLIDFENIENNTFHYTAEFTYKNGQDEFRPDITLFINGLPLVFIEVKKPNNKGGMEAESERMNRQRFPNKKFRRFINITQLMIFSNNMEYDSDGGIKPIQGAFYCTGARKSAMFNCFREENPYNSEIAPFLENFPYLEIDKDIEKQILSDFNCQVIYSTPEYKTNLDKNTPTNRILTSMCSKERLLFLIKYGIAYVNIERKADGNIESQDQKHIMRYQQFFATLAVIHKFNEGIKSGVIWHTQGSGKTALSYYLTKVLTDYFAKENKVTKFYFIVDRLDLLQQAKSEFLARGLEVKTADSRQELMYQFRTNQSLEGNSGKIEITVVNIQRFAEDKEKVIMNDYATNLQRIFIIDEAHRGYNPAGCFLANLFDADRESIKIALTGTPLLKEERASWKVFGNYIHTYYYDKSIQDGYTLKIIREDIETSYREKLTEIFDSIEHLVEKKDIKKSLVVEHEKYVKELLRYIITDLKRFREIQGDETLGGMVICETSEQARKLFSYFDEIQEELNKKASKSTSFKAGLILYDSDDKETRNDIINNFKNNNSIDVLIVFNMLLTGFDSSRLKRLYFGRKLKDHNLLQALTRVNRPYRDNPYGYVIDFADIKKNFDETNEAYLKELSRFNDPLETGQENTMDTLSQILESPEELISKMKEVRQILFNYTLDNVEEFSIEISSIEDKEELLNLKKVLASARDLCNIVRTFGDEDLKQNFEKLEISMLPSMLSEVSHYIDIINQKEVFKTLDETNQIINNAMEAIEFSFKRMSKEELKIIDGGVELNEKWKKVINGFSKNFDQEDPKFISLRDAFRLRFKEYGFKVDSLQEYKEYSDTLGKFLKELKEINRKDTVILKKYNGDEKFARIHKRIKEENEKRINLNQNVIASEYDENIVEVLNIIKSRIDTNVYNRNIILEKDEYLGKMVMKEIMETFKQNHIKNNRDDRLFIKDRIVKEYLGQCNYIYS